MRIAATLLGVMTILVASNISMAERTVTLAWDNSLDNATSGYFVYAVEENSATPLKLDVGGTNRAVVPGLKEGLNYTFFVTAYNPYRMESPPSAPINFQVPVPLQLTPPSAGTPGKLRFPAAPGRWYEVQASTDMVNWSTIWQTGMANNYSWMECQDPRARYYNSRFYRLVVH